jgi:branched-chain amino acid transport system permease protein
MRPMVGEPIFSVVMITIGLAILLQSITGIIWGASHRSFPSSFPEEPIYLGPLVLSHIHMWSVFVSIMFLLLFVLFFKYGRTGTAMRATAQNQDNASLMGISVQNIFAISWAIAMVVSSVGGIFLAHINLLNLNLSNIGLRAFPAVILGGLESIPGAILGGLIIGLVESLAGGYLESIFGGVKEVTAFAVLLLILMIRPYGLFGTEEIERV